MRVSVMFFIAGRKSYPTFGQSGFAWMSFGMWYAKMRRTLTAPVLSGMRSGETGGGSIARRSGETAPIPAMMPSDAVIVSSSAVPMRIASLTAFQSLPHRFDENTDSWRRNSSPTARRINAFVRSHVEPFASLSVICRTGYRPCSARCAALFQTFLTTCVQSLFPTGSGSLFGSLQVVRARFIADIIPKIPAVVRMENACQGGAANFQISAAGLRTGP